MLFCVNLWNSEGSGLRICGWSQWPVAVFVSHRSVYMVMGLLILTSYVSVLSRWGLWTFITWSSSTVYVITITQSHHHQWPSLVTIKRISQRCYWFIGFCQWWPCVQLTSLVNIIIFITVGPVVIFVTCIRNQQHYSSWTVGVPKLSE